MLSVGGVLWVFDTVLIKYGFKNAHEQIKWCLRSGRRKFVEDAIHRHHLLVRLCADLNNMFRIWIFILYYIASPAIILFGNLALSKNIHPFLRKLMGILVILEFAVFIGLNFLNSLIIKSAHRPRLLFYKYLSRRLPLRHRMRIMAFIERLCGPNIGFYCLDLFPMNNYEFYLYITNCVSNYILFEGLFNFN